MQRYNEGTDFWEKCTKSVPFALGRDIRQPFCKKEEERKERKMKKALKALLAICLLMLAMCGVTQPVSARSYYYRGTITIDPTFAGRVFDANDQIEIPLTVRRYLSNSTTDLFSKCYCDVYDPSGMRISTNYRYLSDMTTSTLNWTIFDTKTPRDLGTYTVKYYTSNDSGGSCQFYVNTVSGSFGSALKWSFNDASGELVISGVGRIPDVQWYELPWKSYKDKIQSVVIQNGITSISERAFWQYRNLTSVSLPDTLTQIGKSAFSECANLTTINLPGNLMQIGERAFEECTFLQNVKLPGSLRSLGSCAFEKTAIKNIEIPSGIVLLPSWIFSDCYLLETISIPNSVRGIEMFAFDNCSSLKTVSYSGSKGEWNRINISISGNDYLKSANIRYQSAETPAQPIPAPAQPTPIPAPGSLAQTDLKSLTNSTSGIKVTWNKVSQASGYYIYRKAGSGNWKKLTTIKNGNAASYTDKKSLKNGTTYTYMVKAYSGNVTGTGTMLSTVRMGTPVITSCSSTAKKTITLKWKKNANISGYEIKYSVGSSSRTIQVKKKSAVKYTIKKLKSRKTCTVRMRAYKKVNGKTYYSTWSKAKKSTVR